MALLQLAAYGAQNAALNIPTNSLEYTIIDFIKQQNIYNLILPRHGDQVLPSKLIIKTHNDIEMDAFLENINTAELSCYIGRSNIYSIELGLITKLNNPIKKGNNFIISLPHAYLVNKIHLVASPFMNVELILRFQNDDIIDTVSTMLEWTFLDPQERRQLAEQHHLNIIQQIQSEYINLQQPEEEIRFRPNFNLISKGYFIEGNIDKIINLTLTLNGTVRWDYNNLMLNMIGTQINPKLLYVPFDPNFDWKNMSREAFTSGLNQSRIDSLKIKITFSEGQNNVGLHSLSCNFLKYRFGCADLSFLIGNLITKLNRNDGFNINNIPSVFKKNEKWINADKLIDLLKNDTCPIAYEPFTDNCKYCMCNQCKYNFDYESLKYCFKDSAVKKCPMCKTQWTNWTIYTNTDNNVIEPVNNNVIEPVNKKRQSSWFIRQSFLSKLFGKIIDS